jgi:uncharacterized protein
VAIVNARPADDQAHRDAAGAVPRDVEARLRAALRDAMNTRDLAAAFALRSALSAIGNAGAVPAGAAQAPDATSPHVAGAMAGLGAAEVPRRRLTPADLSEIVRAEAAERVAAAGQYEHAGQPDRAERLRREASILLAVLGETE